MHVYAFTAAFIILDFVTGLVKAFKEHNYCSSVMREGLYHKFGSILCVVFATMIDCAQVYIDLGVTVPVTVGVCGYIILMEIGSTIENVCAINPEIMPAVLKKHFKKLSNDDK